MTNAVVFLEHMVLLLKVNAILEQVQINFKYKMYFIYKTYIFRINKENKNVSRTVPYDKYLAMHTHETLDISNSASFHIILCYG